MSVSIECPNCGKHSVVQHSDTGYRCLACDFERDLTPPDEEKKPPVLLAILAGGAIALLAL